MKNLASPVRLYGVFPYDRSAKVRWILTELGVQFEDRWIDREKNEFESPAFLKLNPMGRIPVLSMGDSAMFESGGICSYLADFFLDKGLAPALGTNERAEYQQWMYFAASTLEAIQTRIMIIEDIPAGEIQTTKMNSLLSDFKDSLLALDRTLKKNPFLVDNRFSAADICVSYHLYWCKLWPELDGVLQDFPNITGYMERMARVPSAIQANVFSYKE